LAVDVGQLGGEGDELKEGVDEYGLENGDRGWMGRWLWVIWWWIRKRRWWGMVGRHRWRIERRNWRRIDTLNYRRRSGHDECTIG
jgi:hypothetical protein